MKILLLGKNGQLGRELQRSLSLPGKLVALDRDDSLFCGDLTQPEKLTQTVLDIKPEVIVNAAAYTAVDKAESEPELARLINTDAPAVLAQAAKQIDAWLIHYSTDYVFDGTGTQAWTEDSPGNPINVYGKTKFEGEQAIRSTACRHLIFRTSWVYGTQGNHFAKTMLRLARERENLAVISDQCGVPTSAELLADVTAHAFRQVIQLRDQGARLSGLYHVVPGGETTWYGYAGYVLEEAKKRHPDLPWKVVNIKPITSDAYPTAAQRPLNSRLDTNKLQQTFSLHMPDWKWGVDRLLHEMVL